MGNAKWEKVVDETCDLFFLNNQGPMPSSDRGPFGSCRLHTSIYLPPERESFYASGESSNVVDNVIGPKLCDELEIDLSAHFALSDKMKDDRGNTTDISYIFMTRRGLVGAVGGAIEKNETPGKAGMREFREETYGMFSPLCGEPMTKDLEDKVYCQLKEGQVTYFCKQTSIGSEECYGRFTFGLELNLVRGKAITKSQVIAMALELNFRARHVQPLFTNTRNIEESVPLFLSKAIKNLEAGWAGIRKRDDASLSKEYAENRSEYFKEVLEEIESTVNKLTKLQGKTSYSLNDIREIKEILENGPNGRTELSEMIAVPTVDLMNWVREPSEKNREALIDNILPKAGEDEHILSALQNLLTGDAFPRSQMKTRTIPHEEEKIICEPCQ